MKPGQPLPPPALPSAGLAEAVLTWPLRSRWPSRAGRPRSPEAREAPGPRCAGRLPLSLLEESVLGLRAQARSHPSVHHSSFPEAPPPPRRTDEERGDSGWHRLAPRCALPGPSALCPRAAAAARHMPPPGSGRGTCPSGCAPGSALPPPRLGLPARSSPFSSRPFSLSPPSLLSPPPPSSSSRPLLYLVVSFSTSRRLALQVGGLPSSLTLSLPGGGGRGYCWPLLLPFLPHPGPPPPPRAARWCNAQAAWVRPKPASLLSMPNCPAGVALDSRVLAPRCRLRLARGGEAERRVGLVARAPSCGGAQRSPQVGSQETRDSPTQRGHTLSPNCAPLRCFRNRF